MAPCLKRHSQSIDKEVDRVRLQNIGVKKGKLFVNHSLEKKREQVTHQLLHRPVPPHPGDYS